MTYVSLFHEGQRREASLGRHASLLAVLAVLADESVHRWAEREALTRALVREQQRAPGPFWSSVLVLAYMPLLQNLRGRLCGDALGRDDYDQLVLTTFLEVVHDLSLDHRTQRTAMYLRQNTQRAVFRKIRDAWTERRWLDELTEDALHVEDEPPTFEAPLGDLRVRAEDQDELTELLTERARGIVEESRLQLVIDTYLRGVPLRELAIRECPHDADGQERAYQRLKRERHRTLVKLRPLLSPPGDPEALP